MQEGDEELLASMVDAREEHSLKKFQDAKAQWLANPSQPYLLTFSGPKTERPHVFCGSNEIAGAECPNCRKPLLRIASFLTAALPFSLGDTPPSYIHLLYCWQCAIPYD